LIRRRGNSYEVRVYNPAVKKKVNVGSRASKREALRLEREKGDEFSRSTVTEITVALWAEKWLTLFPREISAETNYRYQLRQFLVDFGDRKLRDIDRLEARAWAVQHQWRLGAVRAMFNDAIRAGVIHDNPFARLGLQQTRGRKDLVVLTDDELAGLTAVASSILGEYGAHFAALIVFAACTAIRPAELFALDWDQLRLDDLEADIEWQIRQKHGKARPKSKESRTIVVPPPAVDALRTMPTFETSSVFTSLSGRRLSASSHWDRWDEVRRAAGREGMDFYELRHYGATKLLALGLSPEEVAVQMGHRDGGKLVRETYGHPEHDAIRSKIKDAWVAEWVAKQPKPALRLAA